MAGLFLNSTMKSYSSNYLRLLSYTKQLTSHVNQGQHDQALSLFCHIHSTLPLDPYVFPLALKSCAAEHRPLLGASVHAHAAKLSILSNPFVACALIDMYGKCVSILRARQVFDESPVRNVVVWNSMISLYARSQDVNSALQLFDIMNVSPNESTFNTIVAGLAELEDGSFKAVRFYNMMQGLGLKPNLITVLALLSSSVRIASLNMIKEIHSYSIRNNIDSHMHLRSGLVEAYGRSGCLSNAHQVFDSMTERDVVAWSSLISAYAFHGEARTTLEIFKRMESAKVKPDGITFLGVLKACSHAGLAEEARIIFNRMHNDYNMKPNSDHYSCLVDVLSRAGRLYEAYEVIKEMPVKITAKAWGALLGACRIYNDVDLGEIAGRALFELEPNNAANYVILGKIYSTAGRFDEAERLRSEMYDRGVKALPGSSWVT